MPKMLQDSSMKLFIEQELFIIMGKKIHQEEHLTQ